MSRLHPTLIVLIQFVCVAAQAQLFQTPKRLSVLLEESISRVIAADLNGDSLKDVIVSAAQPDLYWFENLGNNQFFLEQEIYEGSVFGEAAITLDVDQDGDLDIITAESFGNRIVWVENLGEGEFGQGVTILDNLDPLDDMILADLDNDGKQDLVVSSFSNIDDYGTVYWLKNLGLGNFSGIKMITDEAFEVKRLAAADLDQDGLLDVIVATYWDFRFDWFKNQGLGVFSAARTIRPMEDSVRNFSVYPADLDGDGDIDIINAREQTPRLSWFENDGHGVFISEHIIGNYSSLIWDANAADFDLDGDLDIFTAHGGEDEVVVFLNTGHGQFLDPIVIADNITVLNDIYEVDIDGDRDTDVLGASTLDNDVWLFENHRLDCTPVEVYIDTSICDSETISFGSLEINHSGTFVIASSSGPGCDTVFILNVDAIPSSLTEKYDTIYTGNVYILPDGAEVSISGVYVATLANVHGCDSTIIVHLWVNDMVNTKEKDFTENWTIYPNPANSSFWIKPSGSAETEITEGATCVVYNEAGKPVYAKEITADELNSGSHIVLTNSPTGIYSVIIFHSGQANLAGERIVIHAKP